MKKIVSLALAFILVAALAIVPVSAASDPKYAEIKRGSAKIDGQIDDIWQYCDELLLDRVNDSEGTDSVVYAKAVWDDENLYILMVANDKTKFNTEGSLSQEDCFEVFFDLENKKTEAYSEQNQFRFLYDLLTPLESGMRNLDNISENPLDYIEIAGSESAAQYIMEVKINSKIGINFSFKANMEIGIDFGYDDNTDDGDARHGQLTWNSDGTNNVAAMPLAMGTIKLVSEDALPPPPPPPPAAEEVTEASPPAADTTESAPPPPPPAAVPQTGDALPLAFGMIFVAAIVFAKRKKTGTV